MTSDLRKSRASPMPHSQTYGALVRSALASLALPLQSLINLVTLLGEKSGGSRTIAILSSFYRLALRLTGHVVDQWDVTTAGPWDSAVRGSAPLRAYLGRALGIELAESEGKCILHFLLDIRKSYDSVRL